MLAVALQVVGIEGVVLEVLELLARKLLGKVAGGPGWPRRSSRPGRSAECGGGCRAAGGNGVLHLHVQVAEGVGGELHLHRVQAFGQVLGGEVKGGRLAHRQRKARARRR